jgi:hypothetical protein
MHEEHYQIDQVLSIEQSPMFGLEMKPELEVVISSQPRPTEFLPNQTLGSDTIFSSSLKPNLESQVIDAPAEID